MVMKGSHLFNAQALNECFIGDNYRTIQCYICYIGQSGMSPFPEEIETHFLTCVCVCVGKGIELLVAETLYCTIIFGFVDPIPNVQGCGRG